LGDKLFSLFTQGGAFVVVQGMIVPSPLGILQDLFGGIGTDDRGGDAFYAEAVAHGVAE